MSKIRLRRAQIRYQQSDRLDVTIKSSRGWARRLAPTWEMVTSVKKGETTEADYTRKYLDLIADRSIPLSELLCFGNSRDGNITFVCYCPNGPFCHTHLLIDYLIAHHPDLFEDGR
jgi:uncharacterized protein YeaO (DUF488 family)